MPPGPIVVFESILRGGWYISYRLMSSVQLVKLGLERIGSLEGLGSLVPFAPIKH